MNEEYINLSDDEGMQQKHRNIQKLCQEYSLLDPNDLEQRRALIQKIVKRIGPNFLIEQPFHCDYGYFIEIGNNVFIGPNVNIYAATHPLDVEKRNKNLEKGLPVKIGNNVWIGGNVTILPGVSIGDNTTIGAGSVVTKDIKSNVVAAGNPCKVIKEL